MLRMQFVLVFFVFSHGYRSSLRRSIICSFVTKASTTRAFGDSFLRIVGYTVFGLSISYGCLHKQYSTFTEFAAV